MMQVGGKRWEALLEDKALTLQVGERNKDIINKLNVFKLMPKL